MTDYFVASGGSNTSPYDTWAKAATSLQTALTAASTNGDRVILQYDGVPSGDAEVSSDTTYAFAANIALICSTNSGTSTITPTVMGASYWVGNSTTNRSVSWTGGFVVFVYGLTVRVSGSTLDSIRLSNTNNAHQHWHSCYLWLAVTANNASSIIQLGVAVNPSSSYVRLTNCVFRFGHTSQSIRQFGKVLMASCSVSSSGSIPASLMTLGASSNTSGGYLIADGCDFSYCTGDLVKATDTFAGYGRFVNCKLGNGMVAYAPTATVGLAQTEVELFNCAYGDNHYQIGHHNNFGSTVVDTGIYANDGASYDGTNRCSWKIVTTANCSYYTPYVSPWIDCYHSGTSAITPSLEIVRSGSATAYQNDEVWGEFSYQGTSGSPLAVIVNDAMALLGTAADQTTGALDASGWTGENATSWFGKLNPTSAITPAEIGHLRARVCVGEPSITVYIDPTIRGRS